MKKLLLVAFLVGCGVDSDPIETETGVLIVVKPGAGLSVSCVLNGEACECTMSECGEAALNKAAEACWRLRNPIVVE